MANISFFYPKRLQGTALGANAGVGNLGVGLAQLIAPIAMYGGALLILGGSAQTRVDQGATMQIWVQNAGFIWVPLIVLSVIAAWFGMDNIATVRAGFAEQVAILRHKQQWRMSWLYTGTFGSFIGLAAGFPMLVNTEFPAVDAFKFAFIGPMLAALVRPLGGWLADRMGGAMITFWIFVVMAVAPLAAVFFLPTAGGGGSLRRLRAGVHGAVRRGRRRQRLDVPHDPDHLPHAARAGGGRSRTIRRRWSRRGAWAAPKARRRWASARRSRRFGGFFIPIAYGTSIKLTGSPQGGARLLQRVLPELRAGDLALVRAPGRRSGVLSIGVARVRASAKPGSAGQCAPGFASLNPGYARPRFYGREARPCSTAQTAAWTRLVRSSLRRMCWTWILTVLSATSRSRAISLLLAPRAR